MINNTRYNGRPLINCLAISSGQSYPAVYSHDTSDRKPDNPLVLLPVSPSPPCHEPRIILQAIHVSNDDYCDQEGGIGSGWKFLGQRHYPSLFSLHGLLKSALIRSGRFTSTRGMQTLPAASASRIPSISVSRCGVCFSNRHNRFVRWGYLQGF
jgi:hypothetical protein